MSDQNQTSSASITSQTSRGPAVSGPVIGQILFGATVLAAYLYLAGRNYLLFHALAEFSSIAVAWTVFLMAWPSRRFTSNDYVLFLGFAYLGVGGLDLVHTLSYKGMGVFQGLTANEPTQLWIAARYLESLALVAAPAFMTRKLPARFFGLLVVTVTGGVLAVIFGTSIFPDCYVEGSGLTTFKKVSEYIISALVGVALWRLFRVRRAIDKGLFRLVSASLVLTILAELSFTAYVSVYGPANQLGHFFKLASFYLIYLGVIHNALTRPYDVLFADLARSKDALQASNEVLREQLARRARTETSLKEINDNIQEHQGQLQQELEKLKDEKHDLVRRVAEVSMTKADDVQRAARISAALSDLREENEILRSQLSTYLLMFEQAQISIDDILADEPGILGRSPGRAERTN
jgi:hypothetical protein